MLVTIHYENITVSGSGFKSEPINVYSNDASDQVGVTAGRTAKSAYIRLHFHDADGLKAELFRNANGEPTDIEIFVDDAKLIEDLCQALSFAAEQIEN